MHKFLSKNFPPAKAAKMRIEIHNFAQYEGETFYEPWDRYKDLLRKCPHHGLEKWMQVHHFYNGLTGTTRTLLDASAGDALMSKSANEAYLLLEDMALNNCQWPRERATPKKPSRHELGVFNNLAVQVSLLTKQLQSTQLQNAQLVAIVIQGAIPICDFCNGPHSNTECQLGNLCRQMSVEQAQYLRKFPQPQFNPYANNFNRGWRNHPNLSRRNNLNVMHPVEQVKPSPPQEKKASLEDIMSELAKHQLELSKSQA